ncbi:MDR family MFS transporter [Paenibacillus sanguinis]|uniref:MDR family MFS transporter n=1 Tax=Paenibacillus sanguinis TaxID=225906 RepID=UPI00037A687B|nr:MDR family MFS transporter [Paenibacillus sanguinis]
MNMSTQAASQGAGLEGIKRLPITIALVIGAFVSILNETLLNVAFTDLMHEFQVGPSTIQWLSTSYMLVIGILVPITALLMQWFTTRQMFLSAMLLFLVGTIVCGIAPSFSVLLLGRVIQAIGTGLLLPVMMNTMISIYPPEKRGTAMGTIGLVIMFGPAIGPTISGLILDAFDWRWLFYLVVPLVVFSILFGAAYLRNVSEITRPKVDIVSILLSTAGFGGIVYGFSSAGEGEGWSSPIVYTCLIVGFVSLILFVWRQLKVAEPTLDVRVFKYPMFALSAALLMVMMMTLFSTMIILPMYLQGALMMVPFVAGLVLLPGGIVNGLMSPIAGRLFDKFGPRGLITPGLLIVVTTIWFMRGLETTTPVGTVIGLHIALLVGISLVMMPGQTTGLNQLPRRLYPHGTAIMNTLQQVSGAIGTALFMGIFSNGQVRYLAGVADPESVTEKANALVFGLHSSFSISMYVGIVALLIGFFLRRTEAPVETPLKPEFKPEVKTEG